MSRRSLSSDAMNHIGQPDSRVSLSRVFTPLLLLMLSMPIYAHNKVVVIPMSGDDLKPLKNVISVAKANGDFSSPIAAMNSIPTSGADAPSATNPYLIVIAPGVYDLGSTQLVVQSFVNLVGSGPNATVLKGDVSSSFNTAALVAVYHDVRIENLAIENTGATTLSQAGVAGQNADNAVLSNVRVLVNNDSNADQTAVLIRGGQLAINDSYIEIAGTGSGTRYGVFGSLAGSKVTISNSTVIAPNTSNAVDVWNEFCNFVFSDSSFTQLDASCD